MKEPQALKISIPETGGEVSALFWRPEDARGILVLGHGAGAGMTHTNMEGITQAMAHQGLATLRYQFPFMERGGGRDKQSVSLATIHAAIQQAKVLAPDLPLLAGGHSFGGRMTSHYVATSPDEDLRGVMFFAFPLHAPGKPGTERATHLVDIEVPMLFLSGERDTLAKAELLGPVVANLGDKAQIHWLETANHGYKVLKRTRTRHDDVFTEMGLAADPWLKNVL
ncbi:MAG: alpha/beta family hydrolase [Bacteroidota bacterium]